MKKTLFFLLFLGIVPNFISINSFAKGTLKKSHTKPWNTANPFKTDVFIENLGQFDNWAKTPDPIKYAVNNSDRIFFTQQGMSLLVVKHEIRTEENKEASKERERGEREQMPVSESYLINMQWEGCNESPILEVSDKSEGYYTFGEKGFENVKAKGYKKLIYKNLYPGIDAEYIVPEKGGIKYSLIIHSGADVSRVKMKYTGDVDKIEISADGNILIKTPAGDIIDHAPLSFYKENAEKVASAFELKGNTVSFQLSTLNSKLSTIIIDPWTTTPTSLATNNAAFDLDYDYQGNLYVSGGTAPFKLSKYSAGGSIIWTFTNPSGWAYDTYYSRFCVLQSGTVFIGEGFNTGAGTRAMKINSSGILVTTSMSFSGSNEIWKMFYNRCTGQLIGFGGGVFGVDNLQMIADTNLTSSTSMNFNGYTGGCCNDVTSVDMDNNGDFFALTSSDSGIPSVNNRIQKSTNSSGYVPPCAFDVSSLSNFDECYNFGIPGFSGGNTVRSNALALNTSYLYSYDGKTLIAWNKTTGAILGSVIVNGGYADGKNRTHEGIDVDECNNVYVGGTNQVHVFSFNGTTFTASAALTSTIPGEVYDVSLGQANKLYVCGDGFVSELQISATTCNQINLTSTVTSSPCNSSSGTASVTASGGTPPYTYLWSPTGQTTQSISGLAPGTYVVKVTDNNSSCSLPLQSTDTVIVISNGGFTITTTPDDSLCVAATVTIGATPNGTGYTCVWSPGSSLSDTTSFNPVATPAVTTTYVVTITGPNGCSSIDSVTVNISTPMQLPLTTINSSCGACDGQATVIPNGGILPYTYSWTGGSTADTSNNLCPGSYTVTVTDAIGCTNSADTSITGSAAFNTSIINPVQVSCNGSCDGTAEIAVAGGIPGTIYNYSWNTTPIQTTAIATGLCAGTYTCTTADPNNCSSITSVVITEPPVVVIAPIANVTICPGGNTTLVASASGGNTGGYNYSWDAPGNFGFATTASANVSPVTTTTYTVNATDVLNNCPAAPVTVSVIINPPLLVNASNFISICQGNSTIITALASDGSGGPYTYSWAPAGSLSNPAINNPTATPTVTTTYTVTASDGCSLPVIDTVTVSILPAPNVIFSVNINQGCAPLCVNFTDASIVTGGTITSWNWNFGDNNSGSTTGNPSHCFDTPGQYSITSTVTSNSGCVSTYTNINMITVFAKPTAEFNPSPNPATMLEPDVTMNNLSSSDVNYWYWNFGDGTVLAPNTASPSHIYPNDTTGSYIVTLIVHNAGGCYDTISHEVIIGPDFTFYIPNAFTPNGDQINDYFYGSGTGIAKFDLWIFDRWGNKIFHGATLNEKWNGKANKGDNIAQVDVYVWKVQLTDVYGKKHNYIGTVSLVK